MLYSMILFVSATHKIYEFRTPCLPPCTRFMSFLLIASSNRHDPIFLNLQAYLVQGYDAVKILFWMLLSQTKSASVNVIVAG